MERITIDDMISVCVKICEEEEKKGHQKYVNHMERVSQIDLGSITEKEIEEIVKPFLYGFWGMGRVLGQQKEFHGWESRLAGLIKNNHEKLMNFKTKDLVYLDLVQYESDIKELYQSFKEVVGKIGAAKVLHSICPSFFPPWDNPIANAVRTEIHNKTEKQEIIKFSGPDYYRFMTVIQDFIKKHEPVLSDLAKRYNRGKLRILDEFLLFATRRPLYLYF